MSDYLNKAKAMQDELSWIRREIHKKPEVGMDLPITTAFVMEQLEKHGIKAERIIDSGISVLIEGGKPGKDDTSSRRHGCPPSCGRIRRRVRV
jgi:metal-dependent amidase/aminoacylase/carboxypeptidase family protein